MSACASSSNKAVLLKIFHMHTQIAKHYTLNYILNVHLPWGWCTDAICCFNPTLHVYNSRILLLFRSPANPRTLLYNDVPLCISISVEEELIETKITFSGIPLWQDMMHFICITVAHCSHKIRLVGKY